MELTQRPTPTRRASLVLPTSSHPAPRTPSPSISPSRYASAFRPGAPLASTLEHEGALRHSDSPPRTSSSPEQAQSHAQTQPQPQPQPPTHAQPHTHTRSSFRSLSLITSSLPDTSSHPHHHHYHKNQNHHRHYHHHHNHHHSRRQDREEERGGDEVDEEDEEEGEDRGSEDDYGSDSRQPLGGVGSGSVPGSGSSKMRPRTFSLPATHHAPRGGGPRGWPGQDAWRDVFTCPVRSFSRTSKGVVNRGDSVRKCSLSSLLSSASSGAGGGAGGVTPVDPEDRHRTMSIAISHDSVPAAAAGGQGQGHGQGQGQGLCGGVGVDGGADGALAPAYYRVAVMGTVEVGKSALCRQFLSSEYLGTYGDTCDGEDGPCIVSVRLDGEETMIEFTEGPTVSQEDESNYDAYILVFSVTDRSSFDVAAFLLRHLRLEVGTDRAIIMVANKVDLVRQRRVSNTEAREVATTFDAKYTETSAALNDHVDDLLVGTLSQIRFQLCPPPTALLTPPSSPKNKCRTPSPLSLFSRFVKYATRKSNSCDNLLLQ